MIDYAFYFYFGNVLRNNA